MYSSTFIFATRQLDDDFHQLDQAIAAYASRERRFGLTGEQVARPASPDPLGDATP